MRFDFHGPSFECWPDQQQLNQWVEEYGENSDFVRFRVAKLQKEIDEKDSDD